MFIITLLLKEKYSVTSQMISKIPDGFQQITVPEKGLGVKATRAFQRSEYICEYRRELISRKEAERREECYPNGSCFMYFFEFKSKKLW